MKVALYKSQYSMSPYKVSDWIEEDLDYVRISEIVEVEFDRLPSEEIVPRQVKQLDNEIEKIRVEMWQKIGVLEEQKSKLLAITQEPS